jgi:RND family efflux transporter MFP subunit
MSMSAPAFDGSKQKTGKPRRFVLIAALVATVLAVSGITDRLHARSTLEKEAAAAAIPTVVVIKAAPSAAGEELVLPGNTQAFKAASIHARTGGFLKAWYTDIGTPVKKGQLLAEIDAPELDQELSQAQAQLTSAQANYQLAHATAARWQGLLSTTAVSKQEVEEKTGDAAAKKAAVRSAAANVARLRNLEAFKRITAPFDGIIVARNTDIGALINAGQSNGGELFRVADMRKLRVYVDVPQTYASSTTAGLDAAITFPEHPGHVYAAKIARTANAIDATTRTLQVELQMENANGELMPGAYVEVDFKLPVNNQRLHLPPTAVLFRAVGTQVATVGADNRVVLKNIVQGRDFGNSIEILSGVEPSDNIVLNPPDWLIDDAEVHIAKPQQAAAQAPAAAQKGKL